MAAHPEVTTEPARVTLREVRCRKCRRLLCKASPSPVRAGSEVEIKCGHCDTMNYLIGRPE